MGTMPALRSIFALALALILALTSQGLAIARGTAPATGSAVICVGGGFATVTIGADGQPVGPAHFCPDGLVAMAIAAEPPPMPSLVGTLRRMEPAPIRRDLAVPHPWVIPEARGPPPAV